MLLMIADLELVFLWVAKTQNGNFNIRNFCTVPLWRVYNYDDGASLFTFCVCLRAYIRQYLINLASSDYKRHILNELNLYNSMHVFCVFVA